MSIRTLIVDDEPLGRSGVSARLKDEPDIEIVGECANGRLAVEAISAFSPELLFLDVQMPGMNGFEVLAATGAEKLPVVIFVTAYDEYALRAFDVHALDYLLKPIDDERFKLALSRARAHLAQKRENNLARQVASLLADLKVELPNPGTSNAQREQPAASDRFVIKSGGRIFFVKAEEVDWIEAVGDYVRLHVGPQSHLLRGTMVSIEAKLNHRFLRIHRSIIVNTERIAAFPRFAERFGKIIPASPAGVGDGAPGARRSGGDIRHQELHRDR
jgi:two-component system LytT family response regulator